MVGRRLAALPDVVASTTVAVINASPAYQAVHGSLSAASQAYGVGHVRLQSAANAGDLIKLFCVKPFALRFRTS